MFKGSSTNPYDDIVVRTTDENLTSENWELILNLCDKVQDEGEQGSRDVVAATLKRLAHRNPNVQLLTLSLSESLSKNCGVELHRELASRAFTQGLEKIITDRNTHDKVRKRALSLIAQWSAEFENDPSLGIMEECYDTLKAKGYKFDAQQEPAPVAIDDEIRRREEEELQRALEASVHDKGGRAQWANYTNYAYTSSEGASGSGSSSAKPPSGTSAPSRSNTNPVPQSPDTSSSRPNAGYVPSASPAYTPQPVSAPEPQAAPAGYATSGTPAPRSPSLNGPIVTRVRALYAFEASEPGELGFDKGDVIKVVDRGYKDWWRGQLKGRTGIFPVNYVEPIPEPTATELAREAESEAAVFSQAANIDRLLTLLRGLDPAKDNLTDNEEIQELYHNSMALRPKIVKLIDKYNQKKADLVSMDNSFKRARTIYEQMMEESLARTGTYDTQPSVRRPQFPGGRPESAWGPSPYNAPAPNYPSYGTPEPGNPPPQAYGPPDPAYVAPQQPYGAPEAGYLGPQPYPPQQPYAQGYALTPQPQQPPPHQEQHAPGPQPQGQSPAYAQPYNGQDGYRAAGYPPQGPQSPAPAPAQQMQQPVSAMQPQPQPQPQAQQPIQSQAPVSNEPAQAQHTSPPAQTGPPYEYDPNGTYPDANAQAWARYYAQGGTDPTGAAYFHSVPGVKPPPAVPISTPPAAQASDAQSIQTASPGQENPAPAAAYQPYSPASAPAASSPGVEHAVHPAYPAQPSREGSGPLPDPWDAQPEHRSSFPDPRGSLPDPRGSLPDPRGSLPDPYDHAQAPMYAHHQQQQPASPTAAPNVYARNSVGGYGQNPGSTTSLHSAHASPSDYQAMQNQFSSMSLAGALGGGPGPGPGEQAGNGSSVYGHQIYSEPQSTVTGST